MENKALEEIIRKIVFDLPRNNEKEDNKNVKTNNF